MFIVECTKQQARIPPVKENNCGIRRTSGDMLFCDRLAHGTQHLATIGAQYFIEKI